MGIVGFQAASGCLKGWGVRLSIGFQVPINIILTPALPSDTWNRLASGSSLFHVLHAHSFTCSLFFPSAFIYLFIHPCIHVSTHLSTHSSTHPSSSPSLYPSTHPSTYSPIHPFIHSPIYPLSSALTHPPNHSSTHSSIHPSPQLSIQPFIPFTLIKEH